MRERIRKTFGSVYLLLSIFVFSTSSYASRVDIWGSTPFLRGADLCAYQNSFGQTRSEYMSQMVQLASDLMLSGAFGFEALDMLKEFDSIYDRHRSLAIKGRALDVTLESTLKASLSEFYQKYRPREERVSFRHLEKLKSLITVYKRGQRPGHFEDKMMQELDYISYGSYSFAPDCRGGILVTLHLIGRDGRTLNYQARGRPASVMSLIAKKIFDDFQRTKFPSTIMLGQKQLTLLGSINGSIGDVYRPEEASMACQYLGGRLPTKIELELLNMRGDYDGGVSIGTSIWALPKGKVYHPLLQNPSPVRRPSEVNAKIFRYYCVL